MKIKISLLIVILIVVISLFVRIVSKEKETGLSVSLEEALGLLSERQAETIINIDNPKTEELVFEHEPSIYFFDENTKLAGKEIIKYTYNTTQDGLLGPITFYVDKKTGVVLGSDYRE